MDDTGTGQTGFLTGLSNSLTSLLGNKMQNDQDLQNKQATSDIDLQNQQKLYEFQKQIDEQYSTPTDPNRPTTVNTGNLKNIKGYEDVEKMFGTNKDIAVSDLDTVHKALNPNSGEPNQKTIPSSFASQYLQGLGLDKDDADTQAQAAQKAFGDQIPAYALDGAGKQGGKDLSPTAITKQFEMANTDPKTGKPKYVKHVPSSWNPFGTDEVPLTQDEIQSGQELLKDSLKNPGSTHIQSIDELNDLSSKAMVAYGNLTGSPKQGGRGLDSFTAGSKIIGGLKRKGYSKLAISKIMRNIQLTNVNAPDQQGTQTPQDMSNPTGQ